MGSDFGELKDWFIGITLAITANIISNLGLNFQKKAHSRRELKQKSFSQSRQYQRQDSISISDVDNNAIELNNKINAKKSNQNKMNQTKTAGETQYSSDEEFKQKSYVCDGMWLLGLMLQVLGALLDFAALGYAPQSVVAPLGSLTLVVNVCLSPCMHSEKPSYRTLVATAVIIIGAVTTVASSPRDDNVNDIEGVFELYEQASFLIYAGITGGFICVGWCLTQYYVYLSRNRLRRYKKKYYKQHRFVIAAISGCMGAQNVLFAKSVSTLVIKSIHNGGKSLFEYWETYLLLAGLVMTIYFQLRWLNSALKRFSALYVAPIFQAFWITVSVMGGLIVYQEYNGMIPSQKIIFPIGIIITIFGVFYLTRQNAPVKMHNDGDGDTINHLKNHHKYHKKHHKSKGKGKGKGKSKKKSKKKQKIKQKNVNGLHYDSITDDDVDGTHISVDSNIKQHLDINIHDDHQVIDDDIVGFGMGVNHIDIPDNMDDKHISPMPSPIQDDNNNIPIFTPHKKGSDAISIPTTTMSHNVSHSQPSQQQHGLMGLIKNIGDIGEASIVTGSSLGKLLLDPNRLYRDINVGANDEDTIYKGILSPKLSLMSDISDDPLYREESLITVTEERDIDIIISSGSNSNDNGIDDDIDIDIDKLGDNNKNDEQNELLIDNNSNKSNKSKNKNKKKKKKKKKRSMSSSFYDTNDINNDNDIDVDIDDHNFSDNQLDDRYNHHRNRRSKKSDLRSRSHSPPLTTDEMAPHEIVWEKFTKIFTNTSNDKHKIINNNDNNNNNNNTTPSPKQSNIQHKIDVGTDYDPQKENGYAAVEDDDDDDNDNDNNNNTDQQLDPINT